MLEVKITDAIKDNYMPYSAYVIMHRALPEIDGFKPSQRRIMYTMFKLGLLKGNRKKSKTVAGQVMAFHPHGDAAIYETMVRMATDAESLLVPYIDSKGNFGKHYSKEMKYADARYTEVRLAPIASELFRDINKNTVEMRDNYDGTTKEPRLLPVTFPNILTNVQTGMAVGMSTSIASFNLVEVIDATINYIKNRNADIKEFIIAPDFPSGGNIVYNKDKLDKVIDTGQGSFDIRASYRFDGNKILFEELPYTTNYETIIDKIGSLVKEGKMKEVIDVNDAYGMETKGIEVIVRNNVDKEKLVQKLFLMTPLQSSFSCNFNIIVGGRPKLLGVKEIIHEWLQFRAATIRNGARFDLEKKKHKKHMLLALKQVLLDIDKAVDIIRKTSKNSEVINNLSTAFDLDSEQAEYVSEIKLKHLNEEYLIQRVEEIESIEKELLELEDLINNKKTLAALIIKQLQEVKKNYGQERKTKVIEINNDDLPAAESLNVEDYNVRLFISRDGYLKKIPLTSLRSAARIHVKEGDSIINEIDIGNNSDILVFTDKQNVYKLKTYDIRDHKPSELGNYIYNLLDANREEEEVVYITATSDYRENLLIGFEDGKVAKIEMKAYYTKQNRSMLKNAYANKKALFFKMTSEDINLLCISSIDKAIIVNTSMINSKSSKTANGNFVMRSKNNSTVVSMHEVDQSHENFKYYFNSGAGIGKYLKKDDFSDLL